MSPSTLTTGRRGERLAAEYFEAIGAKLLERNFHVQYAEVDLIYEHEGVLIAVEVKTRDVEDLAAPEECVFPAQLRRIVRGLTTYAQDNDLLEMPFRIDVVLIVIESDGSVLR
ncbi:MAG: YraN family protein, partial [Chloroflexi bacterium]|nr:YraN family protein [Chloroflexota bacterium]